MGSLGTRPDGPGLTPNTEIENNTVLDSGGINSSSAGVVPGLSTNPIIDSSTVGTTNSEPDSTSDLTGGAGELISQESTSEGPTRSADDPPRGVPLDQSQVSNLRADYFRRGQARVQTLTDIFGLDALVLGHLIFTIPPTAIRIKKGNTTYRWKPLRTQESIAVKSGNGECYIEIDLVFDGFNQIKDSLAELISLWKKVPFCFIENVHIRKMLVPEKYNDSMAVCLESLVLDTVSGRPSTVFATLITKWFNYKPYSQNFWFRHEWKPLDGNIPQQNTQNNNLRDNASSNTTREGGSSSPTEVDRSRSILADLSAIQDPANLVRQDVLPPEVGLFESRQAENPGDPSIAGTYPVVYPFNSQPFLDRVRLGSDSPARINSWSDGLVMNWNSFRKKPVPNSWRYSLGRSPEVSIAATRPRQRQNFRQEAGVPTPVTGDRDIVLFIGDSIMTGFTGLAGRSESQQGNWGTPSFYEWTGNSTFPTEPGFTYIAMCRSGASSAVLLNWWNAKKDDSSLKAEGNSASCSRVAGVVIHAGTNDGVNGPNIEAIRTIMSEVSQYGAIPVLLPLPPSGDATHLTVPMLSHLRILFGSSNFTTYQQALPDYHAEMVRLADSFNNAILLDYHLQMVEVDFRGSRSAPLAEVYMNKNSPQSGYYNIHWNSTGYADGGNWIQQNLPWGSLKGMPVEEPIANSIWTVCDVVDGDTIWVWGVDPDGLNERVLRAVRLQYIDTPETYSIYSNSEYNAGGANPLPNGQDSYRPSAVRYGEIAKNALIEQLPFGTSVEITWGGTGSFGRYLGVVQKGDTNLNLWMVKEGYAFKSIPRNPDSERMEQETSSEYIDAELEAQGRSDPPSSPKGIWAQQRTALEGVPSGFSGLIQTHLKKLMYPSDFRTLYAAGSGSATTPEGCEEQPTRGYITLNGQRYNTSFPVDHSRQFTIGEDGTGNLTAPIVGGVLHWTAAENPGNRVFSTLTTRNISVHFAMDPDGKVWQFADPGLVYTLNAGESLGRITWAIEIANYGAASPSNIPESGRDRETYQFTVHGQEITVADFYPIQYTNIFELCNLIHNNLNIAKIAYTSPHELVPWSKLRNLTGLVGHYHAADNKADPGSRLLERISQQPGWTSASF
jgi:endonuclease YncB( thermonuclease family)